MYVCIYIYIQHIYIYIYTLYICVCVCVYIYIYIYIYISVVCVKGERCEGSKEPVRFDRFRFWTFRSIIGSVRIGSENNISGFDAVRPAFFGRVVARSGSVRFVSASNSGRFQKQTVRFGHMYHVSVLPRTTLCTTPYISL